MIAIFCFSKQDKILNNQSSTTNPQTMPVERASFSDEYMDMLTSVFIEWMLNSDFIVAQDTITKDYFMLPSLVPNDNSEFRCLTEEEISTNREARSELWGWVSRQHGGTSS